MAWIESHQGLLTHPKTRKAARSLGIPAVHLMGHLHALWHWALELAEDGDLSRFDLDDIAMGAEWEGSPDKFVAALVDCGFGDGPGFLEADGPCGDPAEGRTGRLVLHDWWAYAGKLVSRRQADRARKAARRSAEVPEDVRGTSDGSPADRPQDGRLGKGSVRSGASNVKTRDEKFERFWEAYPRGPAGKPGGDGPKKPARDKFRKLTDEQVEACLVAVDHYRDAMGLPDAPNAAHALTWLNQERWESWQEPAEPRAGPTHLHNVTQLKAGEGGTF